MTEYEIYVFLLCLIVFVFLTTLSIVCLSIITRLSLRLINSGVDDPLILEQYKKSRRKKRNCAKTIDNILSVVICLILILMLAGSFIIRCTENSCCGVLPQYRVVRTGSMAEKNEENTYLFENDLNNQIQTFDLIRTEKLPDEMDLELYDIVVYETDGMLIVHRIVEIEEPNSSHPDCRYFRLQGDAVEAPDRFPVLYEQMRSIYSGDKIPFIGSLVLFMQSPAGWLCILLIVVAIIASPLLDKKLRKAREARLKLYLNNNKFAEKDLVSAGGLRND